MCRRSFDVLKKIDVSSVMKDFFQILFVSYTHTHTHTYTHTHTHTLIMYIIYCRHVHIRPGSVFRMSCFGLDKIRRNVEDEKNTIFLYFPSRRYYAFSQKAECMNAQRVFCCM
jgi:hypothetical protein